MNWKTTLTTAATLICSIAPVAAHADDFHMSASVNVPPFSVHVHDSSCHHDAPPPQGVPVVVNTPPPQPSGHYELRTVNQYVPGRYDQVWVPGSCIEKRHGRWGHKVKQICNAGYYSQRWIPERYEQIQKWVWVDDASYYGYGGYAGQR